MTNVSKMLCRKIMKIAKSTLMTKNMLMAKSKLRNCKPV